MRTLRPGVARRPHVAMSRRQRIDCPHERRPGMAVCLHCLHANRVATRARRQRAVMRFSLWTMGLAVVAIVAATGAGAVGKHAEPPSAARPTPKPVVAKAASVIADTTLAVAGTVLQQGSVASAPVPTPDSAQRRPLAATASVAAGTVVDSVSRAAPLPRPSTPVIGAILPQGRTNLPDSLFAVRSGDTVVVHFDTSPARTRRGDKFERIVRQTLRAVYGPVADTLLAAVPEGRLAASKALVTDLPKRGIRLGPTGRRLMLWPETRPGRDGPLVVGYRTTIEH